MGGLERLRQHRMSFILLLLIYLNLAWSIQAAKWSEGLTILPWVAALSVMLGFLLALSRWPAFLANVYSLVTGFIAITLLVGTQLSPDLAWSDRVLELGLRVKQWVAIVLSGAANYDNLVFVLELAVVLWLFGYLSAWGLFRRERIWWATIPPGVGLLSNLYYAPPELTMYFIVYLLLVLVLVVRTNFQRRVAEWARAKIRYTQDVSFDFLRDGILIALLVIILAWALPATTNVNALARIGDRMERPWRYLQEEWNRMFSALTSYRESEEMTFGRIKTFSGAVNLGDTLVMDIESEEGRYWRAAAYDFYGGRGWASTYEEIGALGKGASPIAPPPYHLRKSLQQKVRLYLPSTHSIVAAPQLVSTDVPTEAVLLYLPREGATAARPPADIEISYSRYRLREGDEYEVVSSISIADEGSLKKASTDYPEWIRERYLQLPADLPERVHDLAEEITSGLDNKYSKAAAIEQYLRQITYNEQIESAPPSTEDAVDYFLFEMREGYCDYYASAMVVLSRSAGIPARLAEGYSQGEKLEDTEIYRIRENDGHAWAELFFPQYGWIEFEPTAAEPSIVRAASQLRAPANATDLQPEGGDSDADLRGEEDKFGPDDDVLGDGRGSTWTGSWMARLARIGRGVGISLLVLFAAVGMAWVIWRLQEPRRLSQAQRAYLRMTDSARVLIGLAPDARQTPFEYAGALAAQVPYASEHIRALVDLYVRDQFATRLSQAESRHVIELWKKILPALLRRLLERVTGWFVARVRWKWDTVRRPGKPRAGDGRYAG